MNRRGFLRALVAAPVAAVVAPMAVAKPAFVSGGFIHGAAATIKPEYLAPRMAFVGEIGPELVLPLNTARAMQQVAVSMYGVDNVDHQAFDEAAEYCDELVEVDIADASPTA